MSLPVCCIYLYYLLQAVITLAGGVVCVFHRQLGWCHVICALYIPEAWFESVDTMEPIVLKSVPEERFTKVLLCLHF